MKLTGKKVGIWGFGIIGQSVLKFLLDQQVPVAAIAIMDQRPIEDKLALISDQPIPYYTQEQVEQFFADHDYVIPSAGVDLRAIYPRFQHKIITELDLFASLFHKKIIAITGTVGKTSVTSLLSSLLTSYHVPILTGGNIGIGSFDLISKQQEADYAVLEASDVQLKYCTTFAPDLALWTNFSPNHLDWHGTLHDYFLAKTRILAHQKPHQQALVPFELVAVLREIPGLQERPFNFFCIDKPDEQTITSKLKPHDTLYFIEHGHVQKISFLNLDHNEMHYATLFSLAEVPTTTFTINWLLLVAALDLLRLLLQHFATHARSAHIPEHRLELVATINQVDFYNDSKSTTIVSTLAAINALHEKKRPIMLFLGGLSKGVDRSELLVACKDRVKFIYCFGKEAEQLRSMASQQQIPAHAYGTLEEAFQASLHALQADDQLLFSPGGSSYDLFENYQHRGQVFKQLVATYQHAHIPLLLTLPE